MCFYTVKSRFLTVAMVFTSFIAMLNISEYASGLVERDGIHFARTESRISYPEQGNQVCFQLEDESFWFRHRNNCILELVKKYSADRHFFDIGGGNGFVSREMQRSGITTVLIEPGVQGCLNAKSRNLQNVVCSTLENASFRHGSLPSVGLFDVIEHIEDDHRFMNSINSYLEPGGYCYLTVPAYKGLWSEDDVDAGHFRRYNLNNLHDLMTKCGFRILYSTYIFSILPIPIFLFRSLPTRLGLNKKDKVEKQMSEHKTRKGFASRLLNRVWESEVKRIREGKRISFGSSCLLVARKD